MTKFGRYEVRRPRSSWLRAEAISRPVGHWKNPLTVVYAAEVGAQLIVVVRGTNFLTTGSSYLDQDQITLGYGHTVLVREGHKKLADEYDVLLHRHVSASHFRGMRDIVFVGHSQGGSIVELLSVAYKKRFPDLKITVRAFSPPKTGNAAWATLVEDTVDDYQYAVPKNDRVPHEPVGEEWVHPKGEVFWPIQADDETEKMWWVRCPGRQNHKCSEGVPYILTPWNNALAPM